MDLIFKLISEALGLYTILLIINIFMSWIPSIQNSSFGQMLGKICEPYLEQFRRFIPPFGMIDVSPIVAILVLNLARNGLQQLTLIV
ncbi:YggT family protein [Paenisporosarcina indica]|uniref:YggT family protein n=1 Tax=Paenisporosarcina indica TaxID=650093 RepID=UPI00094FE838|nr:YggT family protein [Paenisporosarcina indica]